MAAGALPRKNRVLRRSRRVAAAIVSGTANILVGVAVGIRLSRLGRSRIQYRDPVEQTESLPGSECNSTMGS